MPTTATTRNAASPRTGRPSGPGPAPGSLSVSAELSPTRPGHGAALYQHPGSQWRCPSDGARSHRGPANPRRLAPRPASPAHRAPTLPAFHGETRPRRAARRPRRSRSAAISAPPSRSPTPTHRQPRRPLPPGAASAFSSGRAGAAAAWARSRCSAPCRPGRAARLMPAGLPLLPLRPPAEGSKYAEVRRDVRHSNASRRAGAESIEWIGRDVIRESCPTWKQCVAAWKHLSFSVKSSRHGRCTSAQLHKQRA